jgi:hypothetical protein
MEINILSKQFLANHSMTAWVIQLFSAFVVDALAVQTSIGSEQVEASRH